jgi:Zn-dependent peptidase ImmA (M78 family)
MAVVKRVDRSVPAEASLNLHDARLLLSRSGFLKPPVDVFSLARYLGVVVQEEIMDDDISGYLELRAGRWVAGVNSLHHLNRRRFSLAHELAHFLLHRAQSQAFRDEVFTRRLGSRNKMEIEADNLAAEILMPDEFFRESVASGQRNVSALSELFGVSTQALRFRAQRLGYSVA